MGGKTQDKNRNGLIFKFECINGKNEFSELFDIHGFGDSVKEELEIDTDQDIWYVSTWKTSKRRRMIRIDVKLNEITDLGV